MIIELCVIKREKEKSERVCEFDMIDAFSRAWTVKDNRPGSVCGNLEKTKCGMKHANEGKYVHDT